MCAVMHFGVVRCYNLAILRYSWKEVNPAMPPRMAFETVEAGNAVAGHEIDRIYRTMDLDEDGIVTRDEFNRYLALISHGQAPQLWPLSEVLVRGSKEIRTLMTDAWFRILDVDRSGSFTRAELSAFLDSMTHTPFRAKAYADVLFRCFDRNLDGKLDENEIKNMLRAVIGSEPSQKAMGWFGRQIKRDQLSNVLQAVQCDLRRVEKNSSAEGTIAVACIIALAIVGIAAFIVHRNRRD